jgi:cobyrinic acid a,c-diamide synthase
MLAAPSSGTGKTTVTLALLSALKSHGCDPVSFKCGPDYIDPMFHKAVLGIPSYNLDLFFTPEETVRGLLCEHAIGHGVAVIEGVMGYYDGSGTGTKASSYELACVTDTPVILVISAYGAFLSIAATINGFKNFRKDSRIAGVLLNGCSKPLFDMMKDMLERETGLPMLGCLPRLEDCTIGSRHLGLVTAAEIQDLQQKIKRLGEAAEKSIDLHLLLNIAASAPALKRDLPDALSVTESFPATGSLSVPSGSPAAEHQFSARPHTANGLLPRVTVELQPRIAVARDSAFCFYYEDNLNLLEKFGAVLVPFSPLHDSALPEGIHALYLGGGYPELYAKALSENTSMLESIQSAVSHGLPTFAECGGYLYLLDSLEDDQGLSHPMAAVIEGRGFKTSSLQRFGYISLTAKNDNLLCAAGESIPAHEFHYWDSTNTGAGCTASRRTTQEWPCIIATGTLFAGFPHLYFYGNPIFAANFVKAAAEYAYSRLPLGEAGAEGG